MPEAQTLCCDIPSIDANNCRFNTAKLWNYPWKILPDDGRNYVWYLTEPYLIHVN